jgi:serine/threonine-protein kinase
MDRVGDYILERKLSQGGMAEVFLARSSTHERQVVVKSLFQPNARLAAMMAEEARIQAQLSHPNVVQVLDLVEAEGRPYIVMEYLDGKNLRELLHRSAERGVRIPFGVTCHIIKEVLSALSYAHSRTNDDGAPLGLVHRDVSPANIFLTWSGKVKLIDFGVAKATCGADRGLTRAGEIKGKISYMSPEQIQRLPLDERSDLFSVGIVLWEMLAMRRLFARQNDYETLVAIMRDEVPPPSKLADVPPAMDVICSRALALDRNQRYPNAEAMLADLQAVVARPSVSMRDQMELLFDDEICGELEDDAPTLVSDRAACAELQNASADANLAESWDDAHRSFQARSVRASWQFVLVAVFLLLGAAAAGVARQIWSSPAGASETAPSP